MPATFRAFLQGLATAAPEVVRLMQYRQQVDLQERSVAVQEEGVKTQKASLAESTRQWDEGKPLRDITVKKGEADIANEEKRLGMEKQRTDLAVEIGSVEAEIARLDKQMKQNDLEFQQSTSEERRQRITLENQKLAADIAETHSRRALLGQQAASLGLNMEVVKQGMVRDTAILQAAVGNDPGFQKFMDMTFTSYSELNKAAATVEMRPSTRIALLGLTTPIMSLAQNEQQIRAQAVSGAKSANEMANMLRVYDANSFSVLDMLDTFGVPLLPPETPAPVEQPGNATAGFGLPKAAPITNPVSPQYGGGLNLRTVGSGIGKFGSMGTTYEGYDR